MRHNNTIKYLVFFSALCGGFAASSNAWAQRARIVVGGANFRPFPVAVPDLVAQSSDNAETKRLVKELSGITQSSVDLVRSLQLVEPKTYLAPEKENWLRPKFIDWVNVGASGLIRGSVQTDGSKATISFRFFDVIAQQEVLSKTYIEPHDQAATAVHKFLDEVVLLLTGERGIFSSRISYIKRTRGGKAVYVCDIDGRNPRRLTDPNALALLPAWDPTGKFVLFTSYMKDNPDLFRMQLKDGNLEWISNKRGMNTGAAVSPDGKRIALTLSMDGTSEVYVMDWDGKNLKRLTNSWGQDMSPTWSPDGKRIAFVSSRAGNPHIYIMDADGQNLRRLTYQGKYNQEPNWSPRADGQIAFTARDEMLKFDIFLVHPESGEITRLTQDDGNNESPSHSPDGHHIVFSSTRPPQAGRKIYIMDVDGNNQRRISKGDGDYETPRWGPRMGY